METVPEETTRQKIRELLSQGQTPRDIARLLDLSTQRVYQHMESLRRESDEKSEKPA